MMNNSRKIWIIADSHFNHSEIIEKFEFRPNNFKEQIIRKIRNNVKENDILIHLWDVIFDRPSELWWILDGMGKCTKVLIRWNHDKSWVNFYMNKWFNFVADKIEIEDYMWFNIVFSHIPIKRLKKWRINIHWHLHTNSHHISEYSKNPKNYILYSAEKENYMPILLNELLKRFKKNNL